MGRWLASYLPDAYVASIYDVPLDELFALGKRLVLTDLDNTLVPWNDPDAPDMLLAWLGQARDMGFEVCILSNNKGPRVHSFAELLGVRAIGNARKPRGDAYREALAACRRQPHEAIMVGDQLMTDIHGGKKVGIYSILVLPINEMEWWGTRILRRIERVVMRQLIRHYGLVVPERRNS